LGADEQHVLRLISTGDSDTESLFGGASLDGSRVFFGTRDALPGTGDTDSKGDTYERQANGGLRLISLGGDDAFSFLLPYSDRHLTTVGDGCFGPVATRLGMLATVMQRWDEAQRHFEAGLDHSRSLKAPAFTALNLVAKAAPRRANQPVKGARAPRGSAASDREYRAPVRDETNSHPRLRASNRNTVRGEPWPSGTWLSGSRKS
jgi:hypothetical protein